MEGVFHSVCMSAQRFAPRQRRHVRIRGRRFDHSPPFSIQRRYSSLSQRDGHAMRGSMDVPPSPSPPAPGPAPGPAPSCSPSRQRHVASRRVPPLITGIGAGPGRVEAGAPLKSRLHHLRGGDGQFHYRSSTDSNRRCDRHTRKGLQKNFRERETHFRQPK